MQPTNLPSPDVLSAHFQSTRQVQNTPRVVAVTSGQRGVGQSVVAVLLGLALSRLGKKVLLLDAAFGTASIHRLMGLSPTYGLAQVLSGRRSLAEVIVQTPSGVAVVPALAERGAVAFGQGDKLLLLQELDRCATAYDFLLVDTGAGLASHVLYFNVGAQERIVVADETPASVIDAYTLIKVLATRYAETRFQVLFSRISQPEVARRSFDQLVKVADRFLHGAVSLEFLGTVPVDAAIAEAVLRNQPIVEVAALSAAGCACAQLARHILVAESPPLLDGKMKFFWQSLHQKAASALCHGGSHAGHLP